MSSVPRKSIVGRATSVLTTFAERQPPVFALDEAAGYLTMSRKRTSNLLGGLVRRGWLIRHRPGVFEITPLWATADSAPPPDRFAGLVTWVPSPYYVAFLSAFELHGWLRQPVIDRIVIASPKQQFIERSGRDRVTWVTLRRDMFEWGIARTWVGTARVHVSDPERTILDALHLPRHAGGVDQIADVLAQAWSKLDPSRLMSYSCRMGRSSVTRRLGLLLELIDAKGMTDLSVVLHRTLQPSRAVTVLDPTMPRGGPVHRRWMVKVNIDPSEIRDAGQT